MSPVNTQIQFSTQEIDRGVRKMMMSARRLNKNGLDRWGKAVAVRSKERCPKDTGTLAESIKTSVRKRRGLDELMASVRTTAKVGEREWKRRNYKGKKPKKFDKKNWNYGYGRMVELNAPFIRPALLDKAKDGTLKNILQEEFAKESVKP